MTGKLDAASQAAALEYVRSLSFKQEFRGPLAAGSGVISGTVTNGTTNQPLADQTMTLHIFDGNTLLESRDAKTDAKGFTASARLPDDATLSICGQHPGTGQPALRQRHAVLCRGQDRAEHAGHGLRNHH